MKKAFLSNCIISILLISNQLNSQTYVNTDWVSTNGQPSNVEWSNSVLDQNENLYVVGNTESSPKNNNILTTKSDLNGNILWQKEYNGPSNLKDYGAFITLDQNENVYVLGLSEDQASSSYVTVIIKYDRDGNHEWTVLNPSHSGEDDSPFGLVVFNGYLYVGTNQANSYVDLDISLQKFSLSGQTQWIKTFDYASLQDGGTIMEIDDSNSELVISGISEDSPNSYELITLRYTEQGVNTSSYRNSNSVQIDELSSMSVDDNGNAVFGGKNQLTPIDSRMTIASLSNTLTLNWVSYENPSPGIDILTDMECEGSGEVIITGYIEESPQQFVGYTAKYDLMGNKLWDVTHVDGDNSIVLTDISISSTGEITVAGIFIEYGQVNDTSYIIIQYDENGIFLFSQITEVGESDIVSSMQNAGSGTIYLNGRSLINGNMTYSTIKYDVLTKSSLAETDVNNNEYQAGEIIVKFNVDKLKMSFIDNSSLKFGVLPDILDATLINDMENAFTTSYGFDQMTAIKIFPGLNSSISKSVNRIEDTIALDTLWNYLLIQIPESLDEATAVQTFNSMYPDILSCDLNYILELDAVSDDPHYLSGGQVGIRGNSLYPNADIEIESAWDVWVGTPNTRVGFLDSGIDPFHRDISAKISKRWDFWANTDPHNTWNNRKQFSLDHGTGTASICGAFRNNSTDIAGIAGGNYYAGNVGCDIMDFRITGNKDHQQAGKTSTVVFLSALINASSSTSIGGWGAELINASIGGPSSYPEFYNEALRWVSKHNTILACSRGNNANDGHHFPSTAALDHHRISVGASGNNGELIPNGGFKYTPHPGSNFGKDMDFVAPGYADLITRLGKQNSTLYGEATSNATPHVTGVATLMYDYIKYQRNVNGAPNKLAPEDVEILLEKSCDNLINPISRMYDYYNGHGRINASNAMNSIVFPNYIIEHHEINLTFNSTNTNLVSTNVAVAFPSAHKLPAGVYVCDIYKIETTIPIPNKANYTILDAWIRNSSSTLWNFPPTGLTDVAYNISGTNMIFTGYIYHVKINPSQSLVINRWYPYNKNVVGNTKFAYTVYYQDSYLAVEDQLIENTFTIEVKPNPGKDRHKLTVESHKRMNTLKIELLSTEGRIIRTVFNGIAEDIINFEVNIDDLESGMYYYLITNENVSKAQKFIKL